jgi:hypothetical protein
MGFLGIMKPYMATVFPLFWGLRAPRTFLGDGINSFLGFAGSKNLSWRPYLLFFGVCGLQEPFLATASSLFLGLRAPRTFLGDRIYSFLGFTGSKNLSWRPYLLFLGVCGLQEPFLATVSTLFWGLRAPRTFLGDRIYSFLGFTGSKNLSWRPDLLFFGVYGLQEPFLATVSTLFWGLRAPRTFLGDRIYSFLGFTGSKNLSWRPYLLFFGVYGLQEPFLATVSTLFWGLRAPRTLLMTVFVFSEFLFF